MTIVGHGIAAVGNEIVETSERGEHAGQRHAAAQRVADELLNIELHSGRGISG